jgi:hypothetical protein
VVPKGESYLGVVFVASRVMLVKHIRWVVVFVAARVLPVIQILLEMGFMAASALLLEQNLWVVVFMAAMVLSVGQAKNNFWEVDLWATMVMSGGQTMMTIWEVVYKGYFGNRIGELFDNEIRIQHLVEDITTKWYHVSSQNNAADRTTRLHIVPEVFGLDSEGMTGPAYLKLPVKEWPVNRDFADRKSQVKLPVEEIRKRYRVVVLFLERDNMVLVFYKKENLLGLFYEKNSLVVGFFYKENLGIIYDMAVSV